MPVEADSVGGGLRSYFGAKRSVPAHSWLECQPGGGLEKSTLRVVAVSCSEIDTASSGSGLS